MLREDLFADVCNHIQSKKLHRIEDPMTTGQDAYGYPFRDFRGTQSREQSQMRALGSNFNTIDGQSTLYPH